jgi:hypothetical protein
MKLDQGVAHSASSALSHQVDEISQPLCQNRAMEPNVLAILGHRWRHVEAIGTQIF